MKTIKDMPEHSRPREKLREKGASALSDDELVTAILPSGDLQPSPTVLELQDRSPEAGKILGLRVLDHVIVTRKGYYSFQEAGLIKG